MAINVIQYFILKNIWSNGGKYFHLVASAKNGLKQGGIAQDAPLFELNLEAKFNMGANCD